METDNSLLLQKPSTNCPYPDTDLPSSSPLSLRINDPF